MSTGASKRRGLRRAWHVFTLLLLASAVAGVGHPVATNADDEPAPPTIYSNAAVVLSDANQVIFDYNAHQRIPMASTTKMMTAIVAIHRGDLDMQIEVNEFDLVGESSMGIWAGEVLTLHDLLYGLLLPSGNDAATAIARSVGWRDGDTDPQQAVDRFVGWMNETAAQFQLRDTHFMNPHGLDEWGHYSSPYDLAIILRAALNEPVIREIMQTRSINRAGHDLWNGNKLVHWRDDILGGKTGFTDYAGFCLASAAWRDGRFVIAVVMQDNGDDWFYDVSNLLDWGLDVLPYRPLPTYIDPALLGTQFSQTPGIIYQGGGSSP